MEVHHHPHAEKKHFKEYLLEFVMIFLAVTLGFIAENVREVTTDKTKEKEYIVSMIEDAEIDTANIHLAIAANDRRAMQLDSLSWECLNYRTDKFMDAEMYRHYKPGLIHPAFVSPSERTIMQLKNAGGMRLIRKKTAVDSIVLYDDAAKKLEDQQAYYELYQNKSIEIGGQLFNFQRFFGFGAGTPGFRTYTDNDPSVKLLSTNMDKLAQFGNVVQTYAGVVYFYNVRLKEMDLHAINLIETLKRQYHLSD